MRGNRGGEGREGEMNDLPAGYSIATALERRRRCSGCDAVREYYEMDLSAHGPPCLPQSDNTAQVSADAEMGVLGQPRQSV